MEKPNSSETPEQSIQLIAYEETHRQAILDLSIRAWAPVFPLMETAVPKFVYDTFYPQGWEARQRNDIADVLNNETENIDVAAKGSHPVGWVCTRMHPEDSMAEVYVLAVDPFHQGAGIAGLLMDRSSERARTADMKMLMVETGDDPGHASARDFYEASGFVRWPVARYFKYLLEDK